MSKKDPDLELRSVIVKQRGDDDFRHFFRWDNAKTDKLINLRVQLLNAKGEPVGKLMAFAIRPNRSVGTTGPFVYIDAAEIATGFEYYTAGVTSSSARLMNTISDRREDMREHNQAVAELTARLDQRVPPKKSYDR